MQTPRMSAIESVTNTVLSFVIAWVLYYTLIPWMFGFHVNPMESAKLVLVFNVVSLARQFVIRRIFNKLEQ